MPKSKINFSFDLIWLLSCCHIFADWSNPHWLWVSLHRSCHGHFTINNLWVYLINMELSSTDIETFSTPCRCQSFRLSGDISPFLAFGYVVGQCQGLSFSGFYISSELALCYRILILVYKWSFWWILAAKFWAVESLADIIELINVVTDIILVTVMGFFEYLFLNSQ